MLFIPEETEKVFQELEATQKQFWNVARSTGNFLNMLIKMNGCKRGLEIGTSNGYSGIWQGMAFKANGGQLMTIEFYDKRQIIALENFRRCGVEDVIDSRVGDACTILEYLKDDENFDYVFIDASKPQYLKYFELIRPHLVKGGVICADNVTSHREKVQDFLDAIIADEEFQTEILDLPAGLSVSYRL